MLKNVLGEPVMRLTSLLLIAAVSLLAVFVLLAQDEPPLMEITVGSEACSMTLAGLTEPEATEEAEIVATPEAESTPEANPLADYSVISLGDDCDDLIPLLRAPNNGTLWVALSIPEETEWMVFETLEDDPAPPTLDRRGRFVGCANPQQGEQVCRVTTLLDEVVHLIEIPFIVGNAYIAPAPTQAATAQATATDQPAQVGGAPAEPSPQPTDPPPPPTDPPPVETEEFG